MDITLSGVVLQESGSGEADKLLTILTDKLGKITIKARGVKNLKSKNSSACQLFCFSEFEILKRGAYYTLKTGYLKEGFFALRQDPLRYSLACYIAQITRAVTSNASEDNEILRLVLNAFFALSNKTDIPLWKIRAAFEFKLMCLAGFCPELDFCCCCGAEIDKTKINSFAFIDGGTVCSQCKSGNSNKISRDVLSVLKYEAACPTERFLSFNLDYTLSQELLYITETYLKNQTERSFSTLKIYKSMLNSLKLTE